MACCTCSVMVNPTENNTFRPPPSRSDRRCDSHALVPPAPSARTRIGVPYRWLSGICAKRQISHLDVVGRGVRAGVPGPQQPGQRLVGVVQEDQDGMEAEPALEVRRRAPLLRVRLHHGGVHIEH
jgi:hypothetical protein